MLDCAYLFNDASVTPNILATENQMSRPLCTKHTCFFLAMFVTHNAYTTSYPIDKLL